MQKSLSYLPKNKQDELKLIVEKIRTFIEPEMLILFGSYARGDYKEQKDLPENRKSGHVSDYDILAVTIDKSIASDAGLWHKINSECRKLNTSTYPRIIAHDIDQLNNRLEQGHYFFSDIKKEGITLYDSQKHKLANKQELKLVEHKKLLQEYFDHWFDSSKSFYHQFEHALNDKVYKIAAFELHQSAEAAYKAILLVFTEYCPNEHFLSLLGEMAVRHNVAIADIFPDNTEEQVQLFDLLDYAYIGARYDPKYEITGEQLGYLAKRVEKLQELTQNICEAKIESFV